MSHRRQLLTQKKKTNPAKAKQKTTQVAAEKNSAQAQKEGVRRHGVSRGSMEDSHSWAQRNSQRSNAMGERATEQNGTAQVGQAQQLVVQAEDKEQKNPLTSHPLPKSHSTTQLKQVHLLPGS